jgi:RNA polymerase sigma-70 factor (ECF subfamily)
MAPNDYATDMATAAALLASARRGDRAAFESLAERYRREIQLHCYRMLGGVHDAEDLVQETLLRAWRGIARFEGRASFRSWLYRIATNACLSALSSGAVRRRVMPEREAPPSTEMPPRDPALEVAWLEPYPDALLPSTQDTAPGPDARYELREAVHLAFIAAIQVLPPRQRAVLLLHDVLGWSAAESARLLGATAASVNSALQRARATLEKQRPLWQQGTAATAPNEQQRKLLDRYVRSWENGDVDAFVSVLREDATLSMPPWREWYAGREALRTFFAFTARPGGHAPFRLVPTAANGQIAFAFYSRWHSTEWSAHSIQLVQIEQDGVLAMTSFVNPALFATFDLPRALGKHA